MSPLLTVREAAKRIGVVPRTVYRLIHEGKFGRVPRLVRAFRISETAVQAYLDLYAKKEPPHDD